MKKIFFCFQGAIFIIFIAASTGFAQPGGSNNSISGFIFDAQNRRPVPDVFVELISDSYSTLQRIKTDSSGRFSFRGMSAGSFKVKVLPYGTNYMEEEKEATVINYNVGGRNTSDQVFLDIYLRLDKRKANISELNPAASVYVQEVPAKARNLYKKGLSQLEKDKEANVGLENLKKAVEIFPTYYDALNRLGFEYVKRNAFQESLPFLIKAIEVNQRSFSSFYSLGVAAYNLKEYKKAVEAFRAATTINAEVVYAQIQYGRVLIIDGDYKEAEKALLKAKTLSKDLPVAETHWQLAILYDKLQRYNEAADELEKFLKIDPKNSKAQQIKTVISQLRDKAKK